MINLLRIFLSIVFLPLTTASAITIPFTDSFTTNSTGPEWQVILDAPSDLFLEQNAGTLQVLAPASTNPNNDALYISDGPAGFRLLTSSNFEIRIDYSFASYQSSVDGGQFGLVFGVGRDLPDGTDSAAIGYGYFDAGPLVTGIATAQYRINDSPSSLTTIPGGNTGTFVISYTTVGDTLTLGINGAGSTSYNGIVQGQWAADSVYVSFGGRGAGFVTAGSNAYFDNFQVLSGVAIPEPHAILLTIFPLAALALAQFRRNATTRGCGSPTRKR